MTPIQALEQISLALKQISANYETHAALQNMVQIIAKELQTKEVKDVNTTNN